MPWSAKGGRLAAGGVSFLTWSTTSQLLKTTSCSTLTIAVLKSSNPAAHNHRQSQGRNPGKSAAMLYTILCSLEVTMHLAAYRLCCLAAASGQDHHAPTEQRHLNGGRFPSADPHLATLLRPGSGLASMYPKGRFS